MAKERVRPPYWEEIKQAGEVMKQGGIILYPTDTIWGLGCDARNAEAVARIYALKQRAEAKSMLCLVDSLIGLERIIPQVPDVAYDMIELAIRPITIIYDKAEGVADNLLAEDGSLGVRMTKEEFSRNLCRYMSAPVVSTSANISGDPSPKFFAEISEEIIQGVDYVVKYRQNDRQSSPPSQIIKLGTDGEVKVIRP